MPKLKLKITLKLLIAVYVQREEYDRFKKSLVIGYLTIFKRVNFSLKSIKPRSIKATLAWLLADIKIRKYH